MLRRSRWKEYVEELPRKDFNELDFYNGVVSHPEPDIMKCKVKWALRSIAMNKALEVMEFQLSYFKS